MYFKVKQYSNAGYSEEEINQKIGEEYLQDMQKYILVSRLRISSNPTLLTSFLHKVMMFPEGHSNVYCTLLGKN